MDDSQGHRPPSGLSDDELEQRLCALAGQLAATEAQFLRLVAELDDRGLWGTWGARSAAHWLSWRVGMRLGAARERVRVAHVLDRLPQVAEAFAQGQLSYCKVRALSRVATPATEAELLEIALGTTGAQLERVVRAWRGVLTAEMSVSSQLGRSLRRRMERDGSVVYTLRVAPDDATVVDAALASARAVVLDDGGRPVETPEEVRLASEVTSDPPHVRADADAFVLLAESFLATGPVGERGDGLEVLLHVDVGDVLPEDPEPVEPQAHGTPAPTGRARIRSAQGQPLLTATALRRMCEASLRVLAEDPKGRPLDLGRRVRHATVKQRRVLHDRDGDCCRFPSCTQRRRLIPHHVDWWTHGGATDMDNLVLLCPGHHRAVHEVGYQVRSLGDGQFSFTRPDGVPVPTVPTMPSVAEAATADTPYRPPVPVWGGERLDLRLLIDGMVANTVNGSGVLLPEVPLRDLPRVLRGATGWPMTAGPDETTPNETTTSGAAPAGAAA